MVMEEAMEMVWGHTWEAVKVEAWGQIKIIYLQGSEPVYYYNTGRSDWATIIYFKDYIS